MLPVYYTTETLNKDDIKLAENSWNYVANDTSPIYIEKLTSTTFAHAYPTCKDWFLEVFYDRLFDIHPVMQ
jgi:hypothetical protein